MTNEISSQITATVLRQNKAPESVSQTDSASKTGQAASKRQESAASASSDVNAPQIASTKLEQAVSDINDYVQTVNRDLLFRVDEALPLGRSIVTVIDADTKETIREFPSEEALALAHQLRDQAEESVDTSLEGLIISAQA